ncbi:putative uncharacterized protein DDB_G0267840 [Periplaneta americana]|uniref:putative uncharacterized protein DDB_G0267840 n=1 Tax=Periplaneta americana TaxID=6978 RepID=UPI0037E7AB27
MQELRTRLFNSDFTNVSFSIINTKLAINETEGLSKLMYMAGDIAVLQEPQDNIPAIWNSILDGGVDHILVLDRCGRLAYQVIPPWSLLTYPYVKAAILSTYIDEPCGICNITFVAKSNDTNRDGDTNFSTPETRPGIEENDIYIVNKNKSNAISVSYTSQQNFTETNEEYPPSQKHFSNTNILETTHDNASNLAGDEKSDYGPETETINAKIQNMSESQNIQKNELHKDLDIQDTNDLSATLAPLVERKDGTVPIKIIMHSPHEHRNENGTISEHEYLVLQTGNPHYHGHMENVVYPLHDTTVVEVNKQKEKKHEEKNKYGMVTLMGLKNESSEESTGNAATASSNENSTEIPQDIREHEMHQSSRNNTAGLDNSIGGKKSHKQGRYYKKHKADQPGTMKGKGHKKIQISIANQNETNEFIIIRNVTGNDNRENASSDTIKFLFHKSRHPNKNIRNEHQTENTNVTYNETATHHPLNHLFKKPKHANIIKPEHETEAVTELLDTIQGTNTEILNSSIPQNPATTVNETEQHKHSHNNIPGGKKDIAQESRTQSEEDVYNNTTVANAIISSEENDESESRLTEFIEHYSKLMKWIDYPL